MNIYEFPYITNISDVLPAIEGRPEFFVAERDGYKVVNYTTAFIDSFPPIGQFSMIGVEYDRYSAILRECRGIIFCSKTGEILRRPLHKFFNVGEREETFHDKIFLSDSHVILEKLDGSMITPFMLDGDLRWASKMGLTDVAAPVEQFVADNFKYHRFAMAWLSPDETLGRRWTPIFEWCSRKQRIVIDHPEDQLVLVAVRNFVTGDYMSYERMKSTAELYDIPVVKAYSGSPKDVRSFCEYVKDLENVEGFVIRDRGHMVKTKCDWYVNIHRAKDELSNERKAVRLILDNSLDDLKPHLPPEDLRRVEEYERSFKGMIVRTAGAIKHLRMMFKTSTRKEFALSEAASTMSPIYRAGVFTIWDSVDENDEAMEYVLEQLSKSCSNTKRFEDVKSQLFPGLRYLEVEVDA
jgi:RNA ligase